MNRSLGLHGCDGAKRIPKAHRALPAQHHNGARTFGKDGGRCSRISGENRAKDLLALYFRSNSGGWVRNKKTVMRGGMMDLEMGFLGVGTLPELLWAKGFEWAGDDSTPAQELPQTEVEGAQIFRVNAACAPAFYIDGRDVAGMSSAESAAWEERSRPAPEAVKASGHSALCSAHFVFAGKKTHPREQFVCSAGAVEVDVVGALGEELGVKEMGELTGVASVFFTRESASEIAIVRGSASASCEKGGLIEDGNGDDGSIEAGGPPALRPLAQKCGPLVFVAVGGAVDEDNGARVALPDKGVKTHALRFKTQGVYSKWKGAEIRV